MAKKKTEKKQDAPPLDGVIMVLDTETIGAPTVEEDKVIELAYAFVDITTACVVSIHSYLFPAEKNDAADINGIPLELLQYAEPKVDPLIDHRPLHVVAFNAEFDKPRMELLFPNTIFTGTPWLCAMDDWEWPGRGTSKLMDIALRLGVGINAMHRAYTDVLLLAECMKRLHERGETLAVQLAKAARPRPWWVANTKWDDKDLVKSHGFRWFPETKTWRKKLRVEQAAALPFPVYELPEELAGETKVAP